MKRLNKTAKVRDYIAKHPEAKASEIAKALGFKPNTVYQVMYKDKKAKEPKKIILHADQVALANKMGIPTKDYAERVYKLTQGRKRRHPITGKHLMQGADIMLRTTLTWSTIRPTIPRGAWRRLTSSRPKS